VATLAPVVGAACVIAAGRTAFLNSFVLALPTMCFVGLISFPLYLWHWPLLAFLRIVYPEPSTTLVLLAVALSFALAALTYHVVEKFMRFEVSRVRWRAPALLTLLFASAILLSTQKGSARFTQFASLKPFSEAIADWRFPGKTMRENTFANGTKYYTMETGNPARVLFVGDSHMQQYGPAVEKIAASAGSLAKSSIWVTGGGTLFAKGAFQKEFPENRNLFASALELLNTSPAIDTVVVGQFWMAHLHELAYAQLDANGHEITNAAEKKLLREQAVLEFFDTVIQRGKKLVVLQDIPTNPQYDPALMVSRSIFGFEPLPPQHVSRQHVEASLNPARSWIQRLHNPPKVVVLDVLNSLCTPTSCPTRDPQGRPLYKDHSHLAGYAAETHLTFIRNVLIKDI
jgi:hypothetical protein